MEHIWIKFSLFLANLSNMKWILLFTATLSSKISITLLFPTSINRTYEKRCTYKTAHHETAQAQNGQSCNDTSSKHLKAQAAPAQNGPRHTEITEIYMYIYVHISLMIIACFVVGQFVMDNFVPWAVLYCTWLSWYFYRQSEKSTFRTFQEGGCIKSAKQLYTHT